MSSRNFFLLRWCLLASIVASARGLYDQCNHLLELKANEKVYINSPYYPHQYPIGSSCRYVVKAPVDYQLKFQCKIKLNAPLSSSKCLNEIFYFNREGSELLSSSDYFCGSGSIEKKSFLNQAMISYISTPPYKRTAGSSPPSMPSTSPEEEAEEVEEIEQSSASIGVETPSRLGVGDKVNKVWSYVSSMWTNKFGKNKTSTLIEAVVQPEALFTISTTTEGPRPPSTTSSSASFIPPIFWRNASSSAFAFNRRSPPRSTSTSASPPSTLTGRSTPSPSSRSRVRIIGHQSVWSEQSASYLGDGGGSFSCLVEVIEPECDCGWSMPRTRSGVDSDVAGIDEFPSMAGVVSLKHNKIFCGAVIINHRYLLSAAHCFITSDTNNTELVRVVVGEHDLSTVLETLNTRMYDLDSIILHEFFRTTSTNVRNDIALLRTREPMEWNRSVGPACLPLQASNGFLGGRKPPSSGQRLDTAGWGTTYFGGPQSSVLRKTTLDVISAKECKAKVHSQPSGTFCTYTPGRDTCQYDSGGALYLKGERLFAVGIVSYGYACATQQPSVNTRVATHLRWIKSKTPEVEYCMK